MKRLLKGEYYDYLSREGRRVHGNNHRIRPILKRRYRRKQRRHDKKALYKSREL